MQAGQGSGLQGNIIISLLGHHWSPLQTHHRQAHLRDSKGSCRCAYVFNLVQFLSFQRPTLSSKWNTCCSSQQQLVLPTGRAVASGSVMPRLKLANMLTVGTRQMRSFADSLIDRLHFDAEVPQEDNQRVRGDGAQVACPALHSLSLGPPPWNPACPGPPTWKPANMFSHFSIVSPHPHPISPHFPPFALIFPNFSWMSRMTGKYFPLGSP